MIKLVRIEAPKIYLTARFTELEAGTLATCELCLFVLLIAYLVVSCFCFSRESHFMRASSDLKGILTGSPSFTLGGVLKKNEEKNEEIDQIH